MSEQEKQGAANASRLASLTNKPSIYSKATHIALLLVLVWLVVLFSTDNKLLLTEHYFLKTIKYLTNITGYKTIILSYGNPKSSADTFISILYIIFTAIFINLYLATRINKNIYLNIAAFKNRDSFSGVMATHIYGKLSPTIYPHFEYAKYESKLPVKQFDEFIIEQLTNDGTKSYFVFFSLAAFILLPLFAIYLADVKTTHIVDFRIICVLMVYLQLKVIFEIGLIIKVFFTKG